MRTVTRRALFVSLLGSALLLDAASDVDYRVIWTSSDQESLLLGGDGAWSAAHSITWGPSKYPTTFRAQWNERGLYVRFDAADEDPWHKHANRDDPIWEEEVVEIFLDPSCTGTNYAEVEISSGGVVCDVRMVTGEPQKQMDIDWNLEGLESRVRLNREPSGQIMGWTAIALLPWSGFQSLPPVHDVALPPRTGDRWRFNVFRIERPGGRDAPNQNVVYSAWSPLPGRSFHVPAVFRYLEFVKK